MSNGARGPMTVRARFLEEPGLCLWCWEIATAAGDVWESSWASAWTGYASPSDALCAGLTRLEELRRGSRPRIAVARAAAVCADTLEHCQRPA